MMLIITLLLVALVSVWIFRREWLSKASRDKVVTEVTRNAQETYARSRGWLGKFRLPFQRDKDLALQFKQWVGQAELAKRTAVYKGLPEDAAGFTAWLQSLSDEDLARFVQELSAFCAALRFELAWLVDPKAEGELKQAAEETVGLYCLATWKARAIQPFAAYRAWRSDPGKRENQLFAQKLYSKLVEAGLATSPPDLLLAPQKERQAHVTQAIQKAAAEDHAVFIGLLKDVTGELAAEEDKKTKKEKKAKSSTSPAASPSGAVEVAA
jgi:hypothetical protein